MSSSLTGSLRKAFEGKKRAGCRFSSIVCLLVWSENLERRLEVKVMKIEKEDEDDCFEEGRFPKA